MKLRFVVAGVVLAVGLTAAGLGATVDDGDSDVPGTTPTDAVDRGFVGLSEAEAVALAEEQGRVWRVSRRDGMVNGLTDDFIAGRVTFEIDAGIVTAATIEPADPPDDAAQDGRARAALLADAVARLVTVDNSFGGLDVFDDLRVGSFLQDGAELSELERDFIRAALSDLGEVTFVTDASAEIDDLFDETPAGVAVVSIQSVQFLGDRAQVELHLWCGSLCGVFLTYAAVPDGDGWLITGTTGPVGIS